MPDGDASPSSRFWRWLGWGALSLFAGSFLWSVWFETLLPLIRLGDWYRVLLNVFGIPIIVAGTGVIVCGGLIVLRNTVQLMGNAAFQQGVAMVQSKTEDKAALRAARKSNLLAVWLACKTGFGWMLFGFALISLGGYLINR